MLDEGGRTMITEVVTFKVPPGMTREQVVDAFRKSVPTWSGNPDLIRKNYIYDPAGNLAGGVYLWNSIADAKRWHGDAFRKRIAELYGSEPTSVYYETPIVVDNAARNVSDEETVAA
jgi:Mg/Co/Ni transporter MgtE